MQKLYIVRHYIIANSVKQAIKLTQNKQPDEVYIADEWFNKKGFVKENRKEVKGF